MVLHLYRIAESHKVAQKVASFPVTQLQFGIPTSFECSGL